MKICKGLKNKDDYKVPYAFNKFFFGDGSDIDLSYDISDEDWNRIKFSHNNLGYWNDYSNHIPISENKNIDLCAETPVSPMLRARVRSSVRPCR